MMEWQRLSNDDDWVFGEKVRGVVRKPYVASVYFDKDCDDSRGGWKWMVYSVPPHNTERGVAPGLSSAITECERVLGIQ